MKSLWFAVVGAMAIAVSLSGCAMTNPKGYSLYQIGNIQTPSSRKPEAGLLLVGGGDWPKDAFRWFTDKTGNGHLLVLRASGSHEAGEEFYNEIGGVASVQTLVFHDRKAAYDPEVLAMLEMADGIFIAGGDQANYVRYWRDTPVQKALNDHVARGRPIGGTSAGLAIMGSAAYGAMDGGSVDTPTALMDPMGPAMTLVTGFLDMPYLNHVVTDTHFAVRDRLGRLIAFVANVRASGDPMAIGLGVDEDGALIVEADGKGRFYTLNQGYVWLVQPEGQPHALPGQPLDFNGIRVTTMGTEGQIDLNTMTISDPAYSSFVTVNKGQLINAPVNPHQP